LSAADSTDGVSLAISDSISLRLLLTCSMTDARSETTVRYFLVPAGGPRLYDAAFCLLHGNAPRPYF
jgi:hypothetical protein